MSNLSPQFAQLPMFMTPHEIGSLESGDWPGHPVSEARGHIESVKSHDWHTSETAFGGPKPYLNHLKSSISESEGVMAPVKVRHNPYMPPRLVDGHHRAVVAMETNRLVPVEHHEIRATKPPVSVQADPVAKPRKQPYALGKFA